MRAESDLATRTFGIEIEMCNLDRSKVALPVGYSWSSEESIDNTDCSSNKRFGGEVNTPPLSLCKMSDLHGLKSVYESMVAAGGVLKWSIYTHVHIYVGDLSLEQLKKVFFFFYVCYPYFKEYAAISECDEICNISMPVPTEKYYDGVMKASSFGELREVFTNQSKKGFIRHAVNISAYFKTKTIEFRTFHATDDFYMAMNCVYSAYRIFYYAISHELEDYKSISSYGEFLKATGLKYSTPPELVPLLYQGNPYNAVETYMTKPLDYSSLQASSLYDAILENGNKELCIVNGFMYYYELFFFGKLELKIYAQDPYCHLLYLLANGKKSLTYRDKLSWLEDYNDNNPSRQVALAVYCSKLQKFLMSASSRNDAVMSSIKLRAKESIEKTEKACERLVSMLTTCEYHVGTLNDAIKCEKVVFFNYGKDKTQKRTFKLISENSDLDMDLQIRRNEFYQFVESIPEGTCFYYLSNSPYLSNLEKVNMIYSSNGSRRSAGRFLYCNRKVKSNKVNHYCNSSVMNVNEIVPPDDLSIDDVSKLNICRVSSDVLYALQKKYIKKVDSISRAMMSFVVMYGDYTLGGFGFTLPKHQGYDLFQLTDFCTNNNIPKLSKFILYCIQSVSVQRELSRSMNKLVCKVLSLAYTHKPVSMKYRGVYTKNKEKSTNSYLAYEGTMGIYGSKNEIIQKYKKMLNNGK